MTTETKADKTTDRYFWPTSCALDILIEGVPYNVAIKAAHQLDGGNSTAHLLRGLSYITAVLSQQDPGDTPNSQRSNALQTVSELTELVSRFVELDTAADTYRAGTAVMEFMAFMDASSKALGEKVAA